MPENVTSARDEYMPDQTGSVLDSCYEQLDLACEEIDRLRGHRLTAPSHYPYNDEASSLGEGDPPRGSSTVNGEILAVLRNVGDREGLWTYPRDVMDALLAIEVDGFKLYQLIDLGRQAVRVGIVDR